MPLYVDEAKARALLDMDGVIAAVRNAFLAQAEGQVKNVPRTRAKLLGNSVNITAASEASAGRYCVKIYGGGNYHINLYDVRQGLLAIFEADWMGQLRTGATNGLAASCMARPESKRVGLIGAGRQAVAQLMALESVGLQGEVCVYARRREQGVAFCEDMSNRLRATLRLVNSAEEAICDADIVVTATNSSTPVFNQEALRIGAHINTMGASSAERLELDPALIQKAALLASDDIVQARTEAAEFITLGAEFDWRRLQPLCALVSADAFSRGETDLTIFKSLGAGLEDLAVASLLYDRLQQS